MILNSQRAVPDPADAPAKPGQAGHRVRTWAVIAAAMTLLVCVAAGLYVLRPSHASTAASPPSAQCPQTDNEQAGNPASADLNNVLVPKQPDTATACRYYGLNLPQPSGTLARQAVVPADRVEPLAATLNTGQRYNGATINCPNDDLSTARVVFGYDDGRTVTVQVQLTGCQFAKNGPTALFMSPEARQQLLRLVG